MTRLARDPAIVEALRWIWVSMKQNGPSSPRCHDLVTTTERSADGWSSRPRSVSCWCRLPHPWPSPGGPMGPPCAAADCRRIVSRWCGANPRHHCAWFSGFVAIERTERGRQCLGRQGFRLRARNGCSRCRPWVGSGLPPEKGPCPAGPFRGPVIHNRAVQTVGTALLHWPTAMTGDTRDD